MVTKAFDRLFGLKRAALASYLMALSTSALSQPAPYPGQREADLVVRNFRLESGAVLPEAQLHYRS